MTSSWMGRGASIVLMGVLAGCGTAASRSSEGAPDASAVVEAPPLEPQSCPLPGPNDCICGPCTTCACVGSVYKCVNATSSTCCLSDANCAIGFACDPTTNVCATSCTSTSGCAAGYTCSGTTCIGSLGARCTSDAGCTSGHCVDGVCCDSACNGSCQACATWTKTSTGTYVVGPPPGGSIGHCSTNPAGTPPLNGTDQLPRAACPTPALSSTAPCGFSCNGTDATACHAAPATKSCSGVSCGGTASAPTSNQQFCDGAGACSATPVATSCGQYECASGACKTSCVAAATDCVPGDACDAFGHCAPPAGAGAPCGSGCTSGLTCVDGVCCTTSACPSGATCNYDPSQAGHCAKSLGQHCTAGAECGSGHCVDGYCCDTACDGQCQACDVSGSAGTCTAVKGAPHGARTACAAGADVCSGAICDGVTTSTCAGHPGSDVPCGASSCTGSTLTATGTCSGSGACTPGASTSCSPYACDATAGTCRSSCAGDGDCASGFVCRSGACAPQATASCSADGTTSNRPDGTTQNCAPYLCVSNGTCGTSCGQSSDCAAGNVCDSTSKSCVPGDAPANTNGSGGCAAGRGEVGFGGVAAALVGLGLFASRRSRRRR